MAHPERSVDFLGVGGIQAVAWKIVTRRKVASRGRKKGAFGKNLETRRPQDKPWTSRTQILSLYLKHNLHEEREDDTGDVDSCQNPKGN